MARDQAKATGKRLEPGQEGTGQPAGEATTGKGNQIPPQGEGQPAHPSEEAAQPNPDKKQVQQLDGNKAVPEAEAKARAYRNDERKWDSWAERDVLRDRRRSDELEEGELRRRIDVYRVAIYDDQYDDQERAYWRDMMDRDRRYLRDRLVEDRRDRENYWRDRR